jgi:hypothetical protein
MPGDLPPYRYGIDPGPHPTRHPDGHGRHRAEPRDDRAALDAGIELFEHGYFWEAHEAWEGPWRRSAPADPSRSIWQALILVAAAALKRARGEHPAAARLAGKAGDRLGDAERAGCRDLFGLSTGALTEVAQRLLTEERAPVGLRLR